jgi:hypothetical protein
MVNANPSQSQLKDNLLRVCIAVPPEPIADFK